MKSKSGKSLVQSITSRLSKLAREQRKPYDKLQTIFLLERAVSRLTQDNKLAMHMVFKGGYVSVRVYDSPRFTKDVDAVLKGIDQKDALKLIKTQMEMETGDGVWFKFQEEQDLTTQSEYGGLRLVYRCGLGEVPINVKREKQIQIDIGTGDPITPAPNLIGIPSLLGDEILSWQVYPVETILAEKLHSILTKGAANSRARDIYDCDLLLPRADANLLKEALAETFSYRRDSLPKEISPSISTFDASLLKRGWTSAAGYIEGADGFDVTFQRLISGLEKIGL